MSVKIIQSFWSKPFLKTDKSLELNRSMAGWYDKRYFYISWALSLLLLKRTYGEVTLITDDFGKALLIDKMKLPYNNVSTALNTLNAYSPDLWTLGKIYSYGLQNKPFLHFDGDVFIWENVFAKMKGGVFCQNLENNFPGYKEIYLHIKNEFNYKPYFFEKIDPDNLLALNAGIIGGFDLDIFKRLKKEVFLFLKKNKREINNMNQNRLNCFIEQSFLYYIAQSNNSQIHFKFNNATPEYSQVLQLASLPLDSKYAHIIGDMKGFPSYCKTMEAIFQQEFPEEYNFFIETVGVQEQKKDTHYQKWVSQAFTKSPSELLNQKITLSPTAEIIEKKFHYSLKYFDYDQGAYIKKDLLYDFDKFLVLFEKPKTIKMALSEMLEGTDLEVKDIDYIKKSFVDFIRNNILITRILIFDS